MMVTGAFDDHVWYPVGSRRPSVLPRPDRSRFFHWLGRQRGDYVMSFGRGAARGACAREDVRRVPSSARTSA